MLERPGCEKTARIIAEGAPASRPAIEGAQLATVDAREPAQLTLAPPQNHGRIHRQVHHRGRLQPAMAPIQDRVDLMLQPARISLPIGQRKLIPGSIRVELIRGSPSSSSNASGTGWSGTRIPIVRRFSCCRRRGVSFVAGSRKV